MMHIIFEAHATSQDNKQDRASGWNDPDLSHLGLQQAADLGARYASQRFDAIYCSDLKRSYQTADIAFVDRTIPIHRDARLRECDYGEWTGHPSEDVRREKLMHINVPFPGGESYVQTVSRMKEFLEEILEQFPNGNILIIGHRATQYALANIIRKESLASAIGKPWKWQPGWTYEWSDPRGTLLP